MSTLGRTVSLWVHTYCVLWSYACEQLWGRSGTLGLLKCACHFQGRRCVLKDCCKILDNTVLPPETVVPPFTVFAGCPGTWCPYIEVSLTRAPIHCQTFDLTGQELMFMCWCRSTKVQFNHEDRREYIPSVQWRFWHCIQHGNTYLFI